MNIILLTSDNVLRESVELICQRVFYNSFALTDKKNYES